MKKKKGILSKKNKRLEDWDEKLQNAKLQYDTEVANMTNYQSYYRGSKKITAKDNGIARDATNTRNIVHELIESQVDPSIPYPKVTPYHEEDLAIAKQLEKALASMMKTLKLNVMNDQSERETPIKGGDFYLVEWDNEKGLHDSIGGISVEEVDPRNVIPQPGVTFLEDMDYFFVRVAMTKKAVKAKYGIDVSDAEEEEPEVRGETTTKIDTDNVTVNMAYHKTGYKKIGLYIWCDDYELYANEDYQCRELEFCTKCGKIKDGDTCSCGSTKFVKEKIDHEELYEDIEIGDGTTIFAEEAIALTDENGETMLDADGMEALVYTNAKVPYYQPGIYPIVLRKNISSKNRFIGLSDVEVIKEEQEQINKCASKINDKIFTAGSFFVVPEGLAIELDDSEFKVVRVTDPVQANLIKVVTAQANINYDVQMLENYYQWAKSKTGITDSYQGKYDPSAKSGTAKQYAINQAAGRLESKRTMKSEAYAKMYELMFKTWLAFADEPLPFSSVNENGVTEFSEIDKYKFLKRDATGELYWNDEFIFETDPTSTLMENREAMWQQAAQMLQSGAFGPLGEPKTSQRYWTMMEKNGYPNAAAIKNSFDMELEQQRQLMEQAQAMQGGMPGEMSVM